MATILVIDDDPGFLEKMKKMLDGAGYEVLLATDGLDGVKLLEKQHRVIDLAIVDLSLPGINGFEIIGAISRRPTAIRLLLPPVYIRILTWKLPERWVRTLSSASLPKTFPFRKRNGSAPCAS